MHEYSVTKGFIEIAQKEAEKLNAKKITTISLVIGDLSTIIDDSVKFYFDIIAKDTIADGAKLIFKRVKAEFNCIHCGCTFAKDKYESFNCPDCGEFARPTGKGKEFYVESIEIE